MFGCNSDRLFLEKYAVKDHISNTKLEKGDQVWYGLRVSGCICWHIPTPNFFKVNTPGPSTSLLKGNLAKH